MFDRNTKNQNIEEQESLVGFFNLLLKVDRRVNPYLYKKEYDRHGSINNTKTPDNIVAQEE